MEKFDETIAAMVYDYLVKMASNELAAQFKEEFEPVSYFIVALTCNIRI